MAANETTAFGIHWFRRDLRIAGNPALRLQFERFSGRVVGVFFFDSQFLRREDFSHHRFALFLETLKELQNEMVSLGGELLVIDGLVQDAFPKLLASLKTKPALVTWNRDYEPYARHRDQQMQALLQKDGLDVLTERDHLIFEPHEIVKEDHSFYQVYSPFAKRWYDRFNKPDIQTRIQSQKKGLQYLSKRARGQGAPTFMTLKWSELYRREAPFPDALMQFIQKNSPHVSISIPKAGSLAAYKTLRQFSGELEHYGVNRDFPGINGTSQMSLYLKNGAITTAQIIAELQLGQEDFRSESGPNRYLKELVWREFYYSILWHAPRIENEAFLEKYKEIQWPNNPEWFRRWCEGTTGFPIIDAGMRQLSTTGWMHNRVRMIVASFLCKDLLIDWRWGENYFMKMLLDGDLAPNNGGWQWAASTGCDPQPYFRIFNPSLQSRKFDPNGDYIRTYVEELRHVKDKSIHEPEGVPGYPAPIVDHSAQRALALALYKTP
ncbi:MAG: cryptochrome/photolyase family protein [Bdellovibrio sp.]